MFVRSSSSSYFLPRSYSSQVIISLPVVSPPLPYSLSYTVLSNRPSTYSTYLVTHLSVSLPPSLLPYSPTTPLNCLSTYSTYLVTYLSVSLLVYLPFHLRTCSPSTCVATWVLTYLLTLPVFILPADSSFTVYPLAYLSTDPMICLSPYLSTYYSASLLPSLPIYLPA